MCISRLRTGIIYKSIKGLFIINCQVVNTQSSILIIICEMLGYLRQYLLKISIPIVQYVATMKFSLESNIQL